MWSMYQGRISQHRLKKISSILIDRGELLTLRLILRRLLKKFCQQLLVSLSTRWFRLRIPSPVDLWLVFDRCLLNQLSCSKESMAGPMNHCRVTRISLSKIWMFTMPSMMGLFPFLLFSFFLGVSKVVFVFLLLRRITILCCFWLQGLMVMEFELLEEEGWESWKCVYMGACWHGHGNWRCGGMCLYCSWWILK